MDIHVRRKAIDAAVKLDVFYPVIRGAIDQRLFRTPDCKCSALMHARRRHSSRTGNSPKCVFKRHPLRPAQPHGICFGVANRFLPDSFSPTRRCILREVDDNPGVLQHRRQLLQSSAELRQFVA